MSKEDVLLKIELLLREWSDEERQTALHLRRGGWPDQAYTLEQVARAYQKAADLIGKEAAEYHNYESGSDLE